MSKAVLLAAWRSRLPRPEKTVLGQFAYFADDTGRNCFPSISKIAARSAYSERQIHRIIGKLAARNILVAEGHRGVRSGGYVTQYRIDLEELSKCDKMADFKTDKMSLLNPPKTDILSEKCDISSAKSDISSTEVRHLMSDKQYLEQKEQEETTTTAHQPQIAAYGDDELIWRTRIENLYGRRIGGIAWAKIADAIERQGFSALQFCVYIWNKYKGSDVGTAIRNPEAFLSSLASDFAEEARGFAWPKCLRCDDSGKLPSGAECTACEAAAREKERSLCIQCPSCCGLKGSYPCSLCDDSKSVDYMTARVWMSRMPEKFGRCHRCEETGFVLVDDKRCKCRACMGTGYVTEDVHDSQCSDPEERVKRIAAGKCPDCPQSKGATIKGYPCPSCRGTGKTEHAAAPPRKKPPERIAS